MRRARRFERSPTTVAHQASASLSAFPLSLDSEIDAGSDLARLILDASWEHPLLPQDVLVVAQKVVSKSEGAIVDLQTVSPSPFATQFAQGTGKDARLVEVVLQQSRRVVKMSGGVLITETHHGFICANAGVDASNVDGEDFVTTLPMDPDASASRLRTALESEIGSPIGVIVSDSFNRPWRNGSVNVALGVSGFDPLGDMRGRHDDHGRILKSTLVSLADEIASAAQLVGGETGRRPVVVVRGLKLVWGPGSAKSLIRDPERDLFR